MSATRKPHTQEFVMEKERFNHELVANLTKEDVMKMSEEDVNRVIDYISPPTAEDASVIRENSSLIKKASSYGIKNLLEKRKKVYSKQLGFLMERLDILHREEGM
jgi:cell fate regulator YaaT (PSP1 superfamily)